MADDNYSGGFGNEFDSIRSSADKAKQISNVPKQTAKTIKDNAKKVKSTGKAVRQAGEVAVNVTKYAGKAIMSILSALGPFGLSAIAVVLAVILAFNTVLMAVAGSQQSYNDIYSITSECNEIKKYFYRFIQYGMFDDTEAERTKYTNIYNYVTENGFTDEMCAIWQVIVYDTVCYEHGYSLTHSYDSATGTVTEYDDGVTNCKYYQDLLYNTILSYYEKETVFTNDEGVPSCRNVDGSFNATAFLDWELKQTHGVYESWHYYYVNNLFKFCLDAFVDINTGKFIESVPTKLSNEMLLQGITDTSSDDYSTLKQKITNEKYVEVYKNMCSRLYAHKTDKNHTEYLLSDSKPLSDKISMLAKDSNGVERLGYITLTGTTSDKKFIDFKNKAVSFLVSNASAQKIVQLALQQVGNSGEKYQTAAGLSTVDAWCAAFCQWLLNQCNILPENVGASLCADDWAEAAQKKGYIQMASSGYTPKAGDFMFLNYNNDVLADITHICIVVSVDGNSITTVDGNWNNKVAKVSRNINDSEICAYLTMHYRTSYLDITTGELTGDDKQALDYLATVNYDNSYKPATISLTDAERTYLAELCYRECVSEGKIGMMLIAQCLRDAINYKQNGCSTNNIMKVGYNMGYSTDPQFAEEWGETYIGGSPTKEAYEAVDYIFSGGYVVHHKILYMYNPYVCTSSFHESLEFIIQYKNIKYFDTW